MHFDYMCQISGFINKLYILDNFRLITATWLDGDIFSRPNSFCPSDSKYASCSDDGTVRVWDFLRCHEERICRGRSIMYS